MDSLVLFFSFIWVLHLFIFLDFREHPICWRSKKFQNLWCKYDFNLLTWEDRWHKLSQNHWYKMLYTSVIALGWWITPTTCTFHSGMLTPGKTIWSWFVSNNHLSILDGFFCQQKMSSCDKAKAIYRGKSSQVNLCTLKANPVIRSSIFAFNFSHTPFFTKAHQSPVTATVP
jgi:hypothetical protein